MLDIQAFLREAAALPGPSGFERPVADYVAKAFAPYCDEVRINALGSVVAHKKGSGPKVMLAAHMDEIALMVTRIEQDGCLRMGQVGGVDPRILPGMRLTVHGKKPLFGVIGAKPPHLLSEADREHNYKREDLYVDVGLPYEQVTELVQIGDIITFDAPVTALRNGRVATKTADDRACVAMMLRAAELLSRMQHEADVYFVATVQEEVGGYGALTSAFDIYPDIGVAIDVCHAGTPGTPADLPKLDAVVSEIGPFVQPVLEKRLADTAAAHGIALVKEISTARTYTDLDDISIARGGVPCVLVSLPLRYMHTSVEVLDTHTLTEGARLLAHFLSELDGDWGDGLWI